MGKRSAVRQLNEKQANARLNRVRVSPRKLNLVAGLIRNRKVEDALIQLQFCRRRVSGEVHKLLQSAVANAENNHDLDIDSLVVSEVKVEKSAVMKRFRARARGRGAKILKPFSNIEIVVSAVDEE